MCDNEEFDTFVQYFYDGIRGRVIRNLIRRACEEIANESSSVTVDSIVRGEFQIEGKDHADF